MNFKKIILTVIVLVLHFSSEAQQKNIEQVKRVVELINSKDAKSLLEMMVDSARIGDMPTGKNQVMLPAILAKFAPIESFKISDKKKTATGEYISLGVKYKGGMGGKPSFVFDKSGRIVELNIVKARVSADVEGSLSLTLSRTKLADTAHIAFKVYQGLIYIPACLNGQEGFFMLDSGSPFTILRRKYVSVNSIDRNFKVELSGMGGAFEQVGWSKGNSLSWAGMDIIALDAPVAEMADMDLPNGVNIFGLLGYGMFSNYAITFDYRQQQLFLERLGADGNSILKAIDKGELIAKHPFEMKRHIPILELLVGEKSYRMGIDCGANVNVMDEASISSVGTAFERERDTVNIAGVGSQTSSGTTGYLKGGKIGILGLQEMLTVVTDQQIGAGSGADRLPVVGLLGTPFLNQYRTSINFSKKEISFFK